MHYHLKTGGVTTVLKQQVSALAGQSEQLVLTGHLPQTPLDADTVNIPELGYSSEFAGDVEPKDIAHKFIDAIRFKFNGLCDVLHVHNPTLAKNLNRMASMILCAMSFGSTSPAGSLL